MKEQLLFRYCYHFLKRNTVFPIMSARYRGKHSSRKEGRPLRVLIDMDGVLCDFETHFLNIFREKHPHDKFIPLEERNTFYVDDQYKLLDENMSPKVRSIWESEGFFRNMPPIDGAIDAMKDMSGVDNVQVFICTSPLTAYTLKNHFSAKEKFEWVEHYLGTDWIKRMIVTKDKTVINGDILIDDKPKISGLERNPTWDHVLFTYCHNRHLDITKMRCTQRLENWTDPSHWKALVDEYKKKIA